MVNSKFFGVTFCTPNAARGMACGADQLSICGGVERNSRRWQVLAPMLAYSHTLAKWREILLRRSFRMLK